MLWRTCNPTKIRGDFRKREKRKRSCTANVTICHSRSELKSYATRESFSCNLQPVPRAVPPAGMCRTGGHRWHRNCRRPQSRSIGTGPAGGAAGATLGERDSRRERASEAEGSFSAGWLAGKPAGSKPNFASKYSCESSHRDLHNTILCTALQSSFLSKGAKCC